MAGKVDKERDFVERENEQLFLNLADSSTSFLVSECGGTFPEADTPDSRTMPLRRVSTSAFCLKLMRLSC